MGNSCLLLLLLILFSYLSSSKSNDPQINMPILKQKNIAKHFGNCGDPFRCSAKEKLTDDWLIFYYNIAHNSRQQQEFAFIYEQLYINKKLTHSLNQKETSSKKYDDKINQYMIGFVDCSREDDLCSEIIKTPILILFIYDGYLSMAGLKSFINIHDPESSQLAIWYDYYSEKYREQYDKQQQLQAMEKKQIDKMFWPYIKSDRDSTKTMRKYQKQIIKKVKRLQFTQRETVDPDLSWEDEQDDQGEKQDNPQESKPETQQQETKQEETSGIQKITDWFGSQLRALNIPEFIVIIVQAIVLVLLVIISLLLEILAA